MDTPPFFSTHQSLSTYHVLQFVSPKSPYMATHVDDAEAIAALSWVEGGACTPLYNITLKSSMDFPVRLWEDGFTHIDRVRYTNLKCLLPFGGSFLVLFRLLESSTSIGH